MLIGNVLFAPHHPIGWIGATLVITVIAGLWPLCSLLRINTAVADAALPLLIVGRLKRA